MAVTADDSVAFPVADFMTGFHGLGSFRDMALAAQNTPGIIGIVALSPAFGHDAKVLVQGTTAALVVEYVLVDGFMADSEIAVQADGIRYLFRTQAIFQELQNNGPLLYGEMRAAPFPPSTGGGVAVGDLCTIALVACAAVSLHLPGNRARRPVDLAPDLGLGKPAFRKGGNKISFFLGEVLVAHRCIPFLGRGRMHVLSHLSLLWAISLHLLVESAKSNNRFDLTQGIVMVPAQYWRRNHANALRRSSVC